MLTEHQRKLVRDTIRELGFGHHDPTLVSVSRYEHYRTLQRALKTKFHLSTADANYWLLECRSLLR